MIAPTGPTRAQQGLRCEDAAAGACVPASTPITHQHISRAFNRILQRLAVTRLRPEHRQTKLRKLCREVATILDPDPGRPDKFPSRLPTRAANSAGGAESRTVMASKESNSNPDASATNSAKVFVSPVPAVVRYLNSGSKVRRHSERQRLDNQRRFVSSTPVERTAHSALSNSESRGPAGKSGSAISFRLPWILRAHQRESALAGSMGGPAIARIGPGTRRPRVCTTARGRGQSVHALLLCLALGHPASLAVPVLLPCGQSSTLVQCRTTLSSPPFSSLAASVDASLAWQRSPLSLIAGILRAPAERNPSNR